MDGFGSLSALGDELSSLPGHESLPTVRDVQDTVRKDAFEAALLEHAGDESAQIDAIADVQNYFTGDPDGLAVRVVGAYMGDKFSRCKTVDLLAKPIEQTYTTADHGRQLVERERVARLQRKYWSPEEAAERWGPEEDLEALEAAVDQSVGKEVTTEGQLWDLYYTILHESKKTPWNDEAAQLKLLDLLVAFKWRTDPPRPARMTKALASDWIWDESYGLWSDMVMFGPSAREMWNDSPGCGAGWHPLEVKAWTNLNGFVARVTAYGVRDFTTYGVWALDEALAEDPVKHNISRAGHKPPESAAVIADAVFGVAEVWIRIAGRRWYGNLISDEEAEREGRRDGLAVSKWKTWLQRFEEEEARARFSAKATGLARECAQFMRKLETR